MKNILFIMIAIILMLSSCITVKFEDAQPKDTPELKEFPESMLGVYFDNNKDTLTITNFSFKYGSKKSLLYQNKTLSPDESVLKKFNDYYVLSLKDDDNWEVVVFKCIEKDLSVFYINLDKNRERTLSKIKAIMPVKEIKGNNGKIDYYLINPSKKDFQTLLDKEIFSHIGDFKRIIK